ncbi:hypothetical protein DR046_08215 [Jannaschia formosa]|nr:hypothetical protein DR046_08215 [Jannaschia formosa]
MDGFDRPCCTKPAPARYRILISSACNTSLREHGSLTVWFGPPAPWQAAPSGKRGGQLVYGDAAIQACLTVKVLFSLPLRQVSRHGANDGVDCPACGIAMCQGGNC